MDNPYNNQNFLMLTKEQQRKLSSINNSSLLNKAFVQSFLDNSTSNFNENLLNYDEDTHGNIFINDNLSSTKTNSKQDVIYNQENGMERCSPSWTLNKN